MALVVQAYTFAYQPAVSVVQSVLKHNAGVLKLGGLSTAVIDPAAGK